MDTPSIRELDRLRSLGARAAGFYFEDHGEPMPESSKVLQQAIRQDYAFGRLHPQLQAEWIQGWAQEVVRLGAKRSKRKPKRLPYVHRPQDKRGVTGDFRTSTKRSEPTEKMRQALRATHARYMTKAHHHGLWTVWDGAKMGRRWALIFSEQTEDQGRVMFNVATGRPRHGWLALLDPDGQELAAVPPFPRANPVRKVWSKGAREKLSRRVAWDSYLSTVRKQKGLAAKARKERDEALVTVREACDRARCKLRDSCAARRGDIRATARAKVAASKQARQAARETHREIKKAEQAQTERTRQRAARKVRSTRRESEEEVYHHLMDTAPELLPVWEQVKRSIKAKPGRSRLEGFLEFVEENPDDVAAILARHEPATSELEADYRAWLESQGIDEQPLAEAVPF